MKERESVLDKASTLRRELYVRSPYVRDEDETEREIKLKELASYDEIIHNMDQYDNIKEILEKYSSRDAHQVIMGEFKALAKLMKEHQNYNRLRILIEIFFPTGLGLYAIYLAFSV